MRRSGILLIIFFTILHVTNVHGQCNFTISDNNPCGQVPVDFNVVGPSGTYEWDFDTDGNMDDAGTSVSYSFPQAGVDTDYTVTLYNDGSPCPSQIVYCSGYP